MDNEGKVGDGGSLKITICICDHTIRPAEQKIIGTCPYYLFRDLNFKERHSGCPHRPPDYYLNYGHKYCIRFSTELAPKLSPEGKAWLDRTRVLLQVYLEKELRTNPSVELDPATLKAAAFRTHPDAYWDAGLYEVPIADKVKIAATPDLKEWADSGTREQAKEVGKRYVGQKVDDITKSVKDFFGL